MFLSYPFVFLFCKISIKPSFLWHSRDCVIIWISLTFLRSGALHWLSDWPKNFFAVGSSYQSSLTPWSSKNFLRSGALMRTHWLPHRPTNSLRSGALIRAYWVPDRATNFFWLGALIWAHWLPDWTTNLFATVNPHQSSVTQVMINNLLAIGSSYWSPLTPALLNSSPTLSICLCHITPPNIILLGWVVPDVLLNVYWSYKCWYFQNMWLWLA